MNLAEWIAQNTTQKDFAREVGVTQAYVSLLAAGQRVPSLRLAKRISQATGGAVPTDALAPGEA